MLSKKANLFDINPDGQVTRNLDVTITGNGGNVIIVEEILCKVLSWSKIQHKNLVPVLGITTKFDHTISVVSEGMKMKNAYDYVQNSEIDPRSLLLQIANGLEYLHSYHDRPLIHGDLRGVSLIATYSLRNYQSRLIGSRTYM
ncbi:hypothetical protein V8B97DRAFT_84717 [Scleroderma yunnanense]